MRIEGQLFGDDAGDARRVCEILRGRDLAGTRTRNGRAPMLTHAPQAFEDDLFHKEINLWEGEIAKSRRDLPVGDADRAAHSLVQRYAMPAPITVQARGPVFGALKLSASVKAHLAPKSAPTAHEAANDSACDLPFTRQAM